MPRSGFSRVPHGRGIAEAAVRLNCIPHIAAVVCMSVLVLPRVGQADRSIIPVAGDPGKDETEPYATYYWYDDMIDWGSGSSTRNANPIWIAYVEADSQGHARIVAKNVLVHYNHAVQLSNPYAVSDSTAGIMRRHPLIENFMGAAVAIWVEEAGTSKALWWSRFVGDVWSSPARIIEDPSISSSPVFITDDAEDLEDQDTSFNRLFWVSGRSILTMTLDEGNSWGTPATIYASADSLGELMARRDAEHDLWLLFDELDRPDSFTVRAVLQDDATGMWSGPLSLVQGAGEASQASLNLQFWDWETHEMLLSWVDNGTYHDTIAVMSNGLMTFRASWYGPVAGDDLQLAANTLLLPGTCIITPYPHVCYSSRVDSVCQLVWLSSDWGPPWPWVLATIDGAVERVTMSGLTGFHFLLCWSESDGSQSDIHAACCFIQVGSADDHGGSPRPVEILGCGPNPATERTVIRYSLREPGYVALAFFDHGGRLLDQIQPGWKPAGPHTVPIEAAGLPAGTYVSRLTTARGSATHRLVIAR